MEDFVYPDLLTMFADRLGPKLYTACQQNDLAQVRVLTSTNMSVEKWSAATLVAASERAADVTELCVTSSESGTRDTMLPLLFPHKSLDPAYRFLVESNLVSPDYEIEGWAQLLGGAAGLPADRNRHSLVEYLLTKEVNPNQRPYMHGEQTALAAAAGSSDQRVLELLLNYGATLQGSAALRYAARRGKKKNVGYLLGHGADVNEMAPYLDLLRGRQGMGSALHEAVEKGHVEIVDMLLNAGADVTLKDDKDRTAREIAVTKGMDETMLEKLSY